jgi:hypothetical protein
MRASARSAGGRGSIPGEHTVPSPEAARHAMLAPMWEGDPARIDLSHEIRTISFENPSGAKGAAGTAHGGRKGAPNKILAPGEELVLAEIAGPGRVRHLWMTFPPMPPEAMRGVILEVFHDKAKEPSVSVPCLDFFGLPHGRLAPYASALSAAQEASPGRRHRPAAPWHRAAWPGRPRRSRAARCGGHSAASVVR